MNNDTLALALIIVSLMGAFLQAGILFILSDMKYDIRKLNSAVFKAWNGDERRSLNGSN